MSQDKMLKGSNLNTQDLNSSVSFFEVNIQANRNINQKEFFLKQHCSLNLVSVIPLNIMALT